MISAVVAFDHSFEQALYAVRDPFLAKFFMWISEFGEVWVVLAFTAIVAVVLAYRKRWFLAVGLLASVCGSIAATGILKMIIARPRPDAEIAVYLENTASFPSTHATLSIAFYGFLLWLFHDVLPPRWRKIEVGAVTVIVLAIGFSRLYLGVHYLSDVLAGYILGGIFVMLGIAIVKKLNRRTTSVS
ncbi:MAG: phosphatase PAP2 family protein [bacterium]|nr:phosphatase PAP2 family protein [bacterium]